MIRSRFIPFGRIGRWCRWMLIGGCVSISSCSTLNVGNTPVAESRPETSQELRLPDPRSDFFGVSNKAREIEEHCLNR